MVRPRLMLKDFLIKRKLRPLRIIKDILLIETLDLE